MAYPQSTDTIYSVVNNNYDKGNNEAGKIEMTRYYDISSVKGNDLYSVLDRSMKSSANSTECPDVSTNTATNQPAGKIESTQARKNVSPTNCKILVLLVILIFFALSMVGLVIGIIVLHNKVASNTSVNTKQIEVANENNLCVYNKTISENGLNTTQMTSANENNSCICNKIISENDLNTTQMIAANNSNSCIYNITIPENNFTSQLQNTPLSFINCIDVLPNSSIASKMTNSSEYLECFMQQNHHVKTINSLLNIFIPSSIRSCADIYNISPSFLSGYYWLRGANDSVVKVYCQMGILCGNRTGGWMRVADMNVSRDVDCPFPWELKNISEVTGCGTSSSKCSGSAIVGTNGIHFSKVCGRIIGGISGTPDSFDSQYVHTNFGFEGVALTLSKSDYLIWAFVAGHGSYSQSCPCQYSRITVPLNIPNYFCSYTQGKSWDGESCASHSSCCGSVRPPWFYKDLQYSTTDDLAVTICRNENQDNEDVVLQAMDLYVT